MADGKRKKIETPKVKKHKHLEKIGMLERLWLRLWNPKQVCLKRKEAPETHACCKQIKACSAEIQEDKE